MKEMLPGEAGEGVGEAKWNEIPEFLTESNSEWEVWGVNPTAEFAQSFKLLHLAATAIAHLGRM
jgi:hypothetical protein